MAGRSVGNIEITVDADTSKVVAKLEAAGEAGGEAAADAIDSALGDIGGGKFDKALAEIRAKAEESLSGIEAEIEAQLREGSLADVVAEIEEAVSNVDAEITP